MGLDQYLYRVPRGGKPELGPWPEEPDFSKGREAWAACNELAYWRKANQIHRWFVEEMADGLDDCRPVRVGPDELRRLRDLAVETLFWQGRGDAGAARARSLLPPRPGFFFGSQEIDEWYWKDLEDTVRMLDAVLSDPRLPDWDIYYEASW